MEAKYSFRPGFRVKGKADIVGRELERVRQKNGGLTANGVVAAARSRANYLHRYFTWDDTKAAEEWRLEQARTLIRSVVVQQMGVESDSLTNPVRVYAAIGGKRERYFPMADIVRDPIRMADLLEQAREELRWFREKYAALKELAAVMEAIGRVV